MTPPTPLVPSGGRSDRADAGRSDLPPDLAAWTGPRRGPSLGCLIGLLVGGAALAVLLGLVVVVFAWRAGQRQIVDAELARLRAAGKPTNLTELANAWTVDPDRPDATSDWLRAIALIGDPAAQLAYGKLLENPQDPIDYRETHEFTNAEIASFLAAHPAEYAAIDRAAAAGSNVRYPVDLSLGVGTLAENEIHVRSVASWLDLRIVLALREGRVDDAVGAIEATVAAGETVAREPFLISQLIRFSVLRVAFDRLEDLLAGQAVTPAQLDRIEALLRSIDTRAGLTTVLDGERVLVVTSIEGGQAAEDESEFERSLWLYRQSPLVVADARLALELFRDLDRATAEPSLPDMLDGVDAAIKAFEAKADDALVPPYLSQSVVPSMSLTGSPLGHGEATRQNLLAGVVARRYALARGRLPRTADELATACPDGLPIDPYDGRPIKVRPLDDPADIARALGPEWTRPLPGPGVAYYGVGRNRVDDGAAPGTAEADGDWPIFLPEAPHAGRLDPPPATAPADGADATADIPPTDPPPGDGPPPADPSDEGPSPPPAPEAP